MRLSGFHLPVEHLSASALAMGMQCPEQYRMKHVLKQREGWYSDLLMGRVDHSIHHDNMRSKMHTGHVMSRDDVLTRYTHYWKKEIEIEGEPEWKGAPDALHDTGQKMALTYTEEVAGGIEPVRVEERFELDIPDLPVKVIGYIDTEEAGKTIERKTSKAKVSKPKPGWRFQGRIYQLQTQKPIEWHVITKQVTPKVYTAVSEGCEGLYIERTDPDVTVQMILQAATTLNDFYARYGPNQTWPMTGVYHDWLCSYCAWGPEMTGACPAWR